MDRTDSARGVNGFAQFPPFGSPPLEVAEWATRVFDVDVDTINGWLKTYGIRFKQFGRSRLIRPDDMWEGMPYMPLQPESQSPKPKRKR